MVNTFVCFAAEPRSNLQQGLLEQQAQELAWLASLRLKHRQHYLEHAQVRKLQLYICRHQSTLPASAGPCVAAGL